jgi:hypothetical protein
MDAKTKQRIQDWVWDVVIGSGRAEEMLDGVGEEPGQDELRALERILGHKPGKEEMDVFLRAWLDCLQQAAHP